MKYGCCLSALVYGVFSLLVRTVFFISGVTCISLVIWAIFECTRYGFGNLDSNTIIVVVNGVVICTIFGILFLRASTRRKTKGNESIEENNTSDEEAN